MDIQFHGANCISMQYKGARIIIDDNLSSLGVKSVTKNDDVALFTSVASDSKARLVLHTPGEYEISEVSIIGIAARANMDDENTQSVTMFKIIAGDNSALITGHIYPELSDTQLETIGLVDVMIVPVGGNGYTVDPAGALGLIKKIEPKIVIPTHYAESGIKYPVAQKTLAEALKELAMEPKETTSKLKVKTAEISDVTQLIVLNKD